MDRHFYVLMLHGDPSGPGAVLTTEPVTLVQARRDVNWQLRGRPSAKRETYPICTYDPTTEEFVEIDGAKRRLKINRGPYTEAGFIAFLASLPVAR